LNFVGTLAVPYNHTSYGLAFDEQVKPEIPGRETREIRYSWVDTIETKEPCIVPPAASKPDALKTLGLTFLEQIRESEKQAIESAADIVYVIGWSVPKTDTDQRTLIRESMRRKAPRKLVVVNLGAQLTYFCEVAELFGVAMKDMTIYNSAFSDFVEDTMR